MSRKRLDKYIYKSKLVYYLGLTMNFSPVFEKGSSQMKRFVLAIRDSVKMVLTVSLLFASGCEPENPTEAKRAAGPKASHTEGEKPSPKTVTPQKKSGPAADAGKAHTVSSGPETWAAAEQPSLAETVEKAKALKIEPVGPAMRAVRKSGARSTGGIIYAPNPDGKTYDIILTYFKQYGGPNELVVIDLGSGELKQIKQPRYMNWHLTNYVNHPNGKVYIAVYMRGKHSINIYDPATNEFTMDAFDTPSTLHGETHPLCLGPDGKIYLIGAHPSKAATACQVDVETGKVVDYGPIGPSHAPNGCWGYFGSVDERHIYIGSGKVPWWMVAYDRETGKSKVLFETKKVGGIARTHWDNRPDGAPMPSAYGSNIVGEEEGRKHFWLHLGKLIPRENTSSPPPDGVKVKKLVVELPPKPELYMKNAKPVSREGRCEVWYRNPHDAAAAPKNPPAGAKPEDLGWKRVSYTLDTYPLRIYRIRELPDGRVFGTAGSYLGHFTYDPETKKFWQSGPYGLSHYATAIHDNTVYMSGYPSSPLYAWDLSKPWTLGLERGKPGEDEGKKKTKPANPELVTRLKDAGTHKMYDAAVGADGRIYFGGRWYRNGTGGGLGWWDPSAKKAGGFWKILSNYQVTHLTTASDRRYIVISTRAVRDQVLEKPTPESGRIFIYDTQEHKIARTIDPAPGSYAAGLVAGVGGARILGLTHHATDKEKSVLYGADAETGTVLFRKEIPFPLGVRIGSNQKERFDYRLGPDGCVWTYIGPALVRIHPENAKVEVVGKPDVSGAIAFRGNDLYLSGGEELRRCAGIVPERKQ